MENNTTVTIPTYEYRKLIRHEKVLDILHETFNAVDKFDFETFATVVFRELYGDEPKKEEE